MKGYILNDYTVPYVLVCYMNEKAVNLNLRDTHFCTPQWTAECIQYFICLELWNSARTALRICFFTRSWTPSSINISWFLSREWLSKTHDCNGRISINCCRKEGMKTGRTASNGRCLWSLKSGICIVVLSQRWNKISRRLMMRKSPSQS